MVFSALMLVGAVQASGSPELSTTEAFWRPGRHYPPPPPPRHPVEASVSATHNVSLSISALPLTLPMLELSAEARLTPKSSLSLIGGLGGYQGVPRYELGAQARGYFLGDFDRGIALGLEGRYSNLSIGSIVEPTVAVGPMLAAKYTGRVPLMLEGQLGLAYVQGSGWGGLEPIGRVNVGWSF